MNASTLLLRTVAHVGIYVIQVVAVWIFLRGHNAPGGGFIAGLVTAGALALAALAFGTRRAAAFIPLPAPALIAAGLLLAIGTGVGGVLLGVPFLTHTFRDVHLPLLGDVEIATATIFDLGVYLGVVGTAKIVLVVLGGQPRMVSAEADPRNAAFHAATRER